MNEEIRKAFEEAGIYTTEQLLDIGATKLGRQTLATQIGQNERTIQTWVNRVDLQRIKGIGHEYTDLLESVGIYSMKELGFFQSSSLFSKLRAANREETRVRRMPSERTVADWVFLAKQLTDKAS